MHVEYCNWGTAVSNKLACIDEGADHPILGAILHDLCSINKRLMKRLRMATCGVSERGSERVDAGRDIHQGLGENCMEGAFWYALMLA